MRKSSERERKLFDSGRKRIFLMLTIVLSLFLFSSFAAAASRGGVSPETGEFQYNLPWTGGYDGMVEERTIRILIPYSKTFYFLDGATPRGLSYDGAKGFEKYINSRHKTRHLKIHVVVIPTGRDELLPHLVQGLGDIAIGNLTITEERKKVVDFSKPFLSNVAEIVVTGKKGEKLKTLFDLAGKEIYVRKSSSYYASLVHLNETLTATGKDPVKITLADEQLEDEDLLAMLDSDLVPMLIVDKHKAEFWATIFKNITLYPELAVRSGGRIGWAFRKHSLKLEEVINGFVKKNKKGTLHGNMAFTRYLKENKYVSSLAQRKDRQRFREMVEYFKIYGEKYDFDYLMLAALAYQESRLEQNAKSHVGAVGVMQILPSTAKDKNVNIPNIHEVEANIHAGTKYLRFVVNRYFADEGINRLDKMLFAFASYNAGPGKVAKLRKEAEEMGLNPNVWFHNVEVVAAKRIGRETVQYVSNIYKYYVVYRLLADKGKI